MKVIIAGTRTIEDYEEVKEAIEKSGFLITEVVSGTAKGVDTLGERWAKEYGVPIKQFKPNWAAWGNSAGYYRNIEMAQYADALILVWTGDSEKSPGSAMMRRIARMVRLKIYEVVVDMAWF